MNANTGFWERIAMEKAWEEVEQLQHQALCQPWDSTLRKKIKQATRRAKLATKKFQEATKGE